MDNCTVKATRRHNSLFYKAKSSEHFATPRRRRLACAMYCVLPRVLALLKTFFPPIAGGRPVDGHTDRELDSAG